MPSPTFSFEFFPPKNAQGEESLLSAMSDLAKLKPQYMTVTYGAGGSTKDGTHAALMRAKALGVPLASHLTYINATKKDIYATADRLWNDGVKHIVALRGDMPKDLSWPLDPDALYFQLTSEFVAALHARHDFEISVAAYPEKHPDAPDLSADIDALKKKCDAGATRAITQFFFDNDVYFKFLDECAAAGIKTPIYPGLLPIHDYKGMLRFAERCKARTPDWVCAKFEGLENKPEEARKVAEELLTKQAMDLAARGVKHIHFYTLNKAGITAEACKALNKGTI